MIKLVTVIILALLAAPAQNFCERQGKVRFVTSHADYKIYVVNSFPDARVRLVESFPDDPGEWRVVDSGEDFTVQLVASMANADYRVQFVAGWPGCPRR